MCKTGNKAFRKFKLLFSEFGKQIVAYVCTWRTRKSIFGLLQLSFCNDPVETINRIVQPEVFNPKPSTTTCYLSHTCVIFPVIFVSIYKRSAGSYLLTSKRNSRRSCNCSENHKTKLLIRVLRSWNASSRNHVFRSYLTAALCSSVFWFVTVMQIEMLAPVDSEYYPYVQ
jgi:hypothetical protein